MQPSQLEKPGNHLQSLIVIHIHYSCYYLLELLENTCVLETASLVEDCPGVLAAVPSVAAGLMRKAGQLNPQEPGWQGLECKNEGVRAFLNLRWVRPHPVIAV